VKVWSIRIDTNFNRNGTICVVFSSSHLFLAGSVLRVKVVSECVSELENSPALNELFYGRFKELDVDPAGVGVTVLELW
jgi:hypothetical protein